MNGLEAHYRRLIALYPAAHRQRYQREMLSTLMDGASENQRAPRLRETIDLLWNALWLRLNRDGAPPARDPRWAAAAAVFGALGALTIAGLHVMGPLGEWGWRQRLAALGMPHSETSWIPFAQGAIWLAVAVAALPGRQRIAAALPGRQRIAAILSWATVLGTTAWALREQVLLTEWSLIVVGVVVAGCLTLAKGPIALRAWHVAVFAGVAAACAVSQWANAMLADMRVVRGGGAVMVHQWGWDLPMKPGMGVNGTLPLTLIAVFLAVTVWIQYKVDPGLRRRLRAYAWVPFATYVLVTTMRPASDSLPLQGIQWVALILVPLVTFGIGVIVVRRKDSKQRLIEVGRAHS